MSARTTNEGRVYLRRSLSKQETGIVEQLNWAIAEAAKAQVRLDAAPADLQHMVGHGLTHYKHIYLDDGITGSDLNRPGFVACRQEALRDSRVSHLFIHISDRFARPEQATEALMQEITLLLAGVTIVFGNRVSLPRERGLHYFDRDILLLYEYTQNGEFLTRLATRVVQAQVNLARRGFRTGGSAPYGFTRVLVDAQGNEIQELPEKTTIRREGCHVSIKPQDLAKIQTWAYILHLYGAERWGMLRIVHHLNSLGIPAPNTGRQRRVHGRLRTVSGKWSLRTVGHLLSNAAIVGMAEYGKKSGGKHRRLGSDGPRTLTDADRQTNGAAKLVYNPKEKFIRAPVPADYDAPANQELFDSCQAIRDQRAENRRGVPRCPDRSKYPLATRIFDLTDDCGAVFYGRSAR